MGSITAQVIANSFLTNTSPRTSAMTNNSDLPASATLTGKAVQDALHFGHAIECPVKTVGGQLYVRISAAVYNERSDYEALARAVDAMRRR
jgi:selenocysteine lyase/cysteine desulfurase